MDKLHHKQKSFCFKRPTYREGRWETAVKVYTINQESKYLLIQGVPSLNVSRELVERFALYGDIEEYRLLDSYPSEDFTEAYLIKYKRLVSARYGKKKMDNCSFYGGQLHVCYAPEHESVDDTRKKIKERISSVRKKCQEYVHDKSLLSSTDVSISQEHTSDIEKNIVEPKSCNTHLSVSESSSSRTSFVSETSSFISPSTKTTLVIDPTLPRLPTKNATLPTNLQNLSTMQVYPAYYNSIANSSRNVVNSSFNDNQSGTLVSHNEVDEVSSNSKETVKRRKIINWSKLLPNKSEKSEKSSDKIEFSFKRDIGPCSSIESYACNPNQLHEKDVLTEKDELDSTVQSIRLKLHNSSEFAQMKKDTSVCPLQSTSGTSNLMVPNVLSKKRKNDGRKRV